ncbi:MAG: C39 family peptidase, partial [Chloroflexota bacterium]
MTSKVKVRSLGIWTLVLVMVLVVTSLGNSFGSAQADELPPIATGETSTEYLTVDTYTAEDGTSLVATGIHGPSSPPLGYEAETASIDPQSMMASHLTVPTYSWVFGCSAVSGAMIAGYYDRNGYANMYTGPTAGGVMPLTDTSWPSWNDGYETYPNNPLIASHKGVDGRAAALKGSIDDYWVKYGSSANDPYITGGWTQHTWGTAIGDYMKTSQSAYYSTDGSTWFYNYNSSSKLTCTAMQTLNSGKGSYTIAQVDGTYGRKLFYEKKGYTVTDCYNQPTDNKYAGGFSLANFKSEINAGRPVLLNLAGHSIVGVGYSTTSNTIYIHDTWHSSGDQTMTWGGSYSGMALQSGSIVNLQAAAPSVIPTPLNPKGTITDRTPTYQWSKVTGATNYQYQLYKGTTLVYTKTVTSDVCGTTTCSNTPTNTLAYAAYKWRVKAKIGGVWKSYSAYKNFTVAAPVVIPTPLKPTGTITDTTPTYQWSKISGATNYLYQLYRGTTLVYTKTVTSGVCGSTTCSNTPTNVLPYASTYKWRVRAKVGGVWKPYSVYKTFTVAMPTTGFNSTFNGSKAGWYNVKGTWNIFGGKYLRSSGLE